jgi:hypothetical protein
LIYYYGNLLGSLAMTSISLKLPEPLVETSTSCAEALHISRAEYIRRALERMNRETQLMISAKRLAGASKKVRKESMSVNAEFSALEEDPRV